MIFPGGPAYSARDETQVSFHLARYPLVSDATAEVKAYLLRAIDLKRAMILISL